MTALARLNKLLPNVATVMTVAGYKLKAFITNLKILRLRSEGKFWKRVEAPYYYKYDKRKINLGLPRNS